MCWPSRQQACAQLRARGVVQATGGDPATSVTLRAIRRAFKSLEALLQTWADCRLTNRVTRRREPITAGTVAAALGDVRIDVQGPGKWPAFRDKSNPAKPLASGPGHLSPGGSRRKRKGTLIVPPMSSPASRARIASSE